MSEIEKIEPVIFKINTASGSGTGFYIQDQNLVVTNYHVVSGYKKVAIEMQDKNTLSADVMVINPLIDIALLKPEKTLSGLPGVSFQKQDSIKNRDKVSVLGFPFGMPFTITEGIISSAKQLLNGQTYIQTRCSSHPLHIAFANYAAVARAIMMSNSSMISNCYGFKPTMWMNTDASWFISWWKFHFRIIIH